jgi:ankyrin repeat protein
MIPKPRKMEMKISSIKLSHVLGFLSLIILCIPNNRLLAQTAPTASEVKSYAGLHLAAHTGNLSQIQELISVGTPLEEQDSSGRTALHIAAFASHQEIIAILAKAGANMNALDHQAYDIVTIASVANDYEVLDVALTNGTSSSNVTSPYEGTALIAAAHLGHHKVVKQLIDAAAPLDHVNNLGWTALIEAVILGDGGPDHIETTRNLVNAGANKSITDNQGLTPLDLARSLGYREIVSLLE